MLERLPWYVRLVFFLLVFAMVAAGLGITVLTLRYAFTSPDPYAMRTRERGHSDVHLDELPSHVAQAVLAAMDPRFFAHRGVDPSGFARATWANLSSGRVAAGGATLTQQLAATLSPASERRWMHELEDLAFALWLETRLTKHQVLELYLNTADFGAGAIGIQAAAQRTFDKSAPALTLGEAAILAGLLEGARDNATRSSADAARTRGRLVLGRMREAGLISAEAERGAAGERIAFASARREQAGGADAIQLLLDGSPPSPPPRDASPRMEPRPTTPAYPRAYPVQPIDADVIAQALGEGVLDHAGSRTPARFAGDADPPEAAGAAQPAGLMSLGIAPH
jgi:membrane peptidoglycan carboxypeptidase